MDKVITKTDIVSKIAKETGLSKSNAGKAVDSFLKTVKKELKAKHTVRILGFGSFSASRRKERTGRNLQTGQKIKIPACWYPKFKPGRELKESLK